MHWDGSALKCIEIVMHRNGAWCIEIVVHKIALTWEYNVLKCIKIVMDCNDCNALHCIEIVIAAFCWWFGDKSRRQDGGWWCSWSSLHSISHTSPPLIYHALNMGCKSKEVYFWLTLLATPSLLYCTTRCTRICKLKEIYFWFSTTSFTLLSTPLLLYFIMRWM